MALSNIDKISTYEYVYTEQEVDSILTDYFDVMDIDDTQKEKRKDLAKKVRNALLFLFALINVSYEYDYLSYEYVLGQFRAEFQKVVLQYGRLDIYTEQYIQKVTKDVVDTTFKNLDLVNPSYWMSDERAIEIGANEANSVFNYVEYQEAIESGYSNKTWVPEDDNKVRPDHVKMRNVTIPIEEMFQLPDCEMIVPHDEVNGTARQCSNCRCSIKYS